MGNEYEVSIEKSGVVRYRNNIDCQDGALLYIKPDNAKYIIDPIMSELFCYDSDDHGGPCIDGHYWKLSFYLKDELVDEIEGWTNEDPWRYAQIYKIIKFTERYIPKDMGAQYMITEE